MRKFVDPASQDTNFPGSLLESDVGFYLVETFSPQSAPASMKHHAAAESVAGTAVQMSAAADDDTAAAGGGSSAGTVVQMGAAGGLIFNITFDSTVAGAPAGFKSAIAAVVNYYASVFHDPITVTLDVGWGEVAGQSLAPGALGESETNLGVFSYSQVRAALARDAKSADDTAAVASLPGSDPTGGGSFVIATAEARALGLGTNAAVDGYVGFSSSASYTFDPNNRALPGAYDFIGVAEHEISEIMGRIALLGIPIGSLSHTYTALDLFRYSSPSVRQLVASNAAYFSPDGGNTHLSSFNTLSNGDAGDWANGGGNDSYNAFIGSGVAEPVSANDLRVMDAIGWDSAAAKIDTPPVVTPVSVNVAAASGQTFAAASLFTASDPEGDTITQYDLKDTGAGGGHFAVNSVTQPVNQEIIISTAQLAQTIYQAGSAADGLMVRAYDGTQWGAWASFTVTGKPPVNSPPIVAPVNANVTAVNGQTFAASSLFTVSDPDGGAITQYDLWDTGIGGGRFVVNGVVKPANRDIIVSAAQLGQVTYRAGKGTDTLSARADDGTQWGAWSSFTVTGAAGSHASPFAATTGGGHLKLGWDGSSSFGGLETSFLAHS
jgi:hypothetical protein